MESSADRWALAEFGPTRLGDTRLTRRVVALAAGLAKRPSGVVARTVVEPSAREASYRLLENDKVSGTAVAEAMFEATASRCRGLHFVFVATDGSSVAIADERRRRGTGPVGTHDRGARGFQMMSALAVAPDGTPLGLCAQEWWARDEERKTRPQKDRRRADDKETVRWVHALATARRSLVLTVLSAAEPPKRDQRSSKIPTRGQA